MNKDKPVVILKLDDLRDYNLDNFTRVADFVLSQNIKASFGINGIYLSGKSKEDPYVSRIKAWDRTGHIEIWHHGWDHSTAEDRSWYEYSERHKDSREEYGDITSNRNFERQFRDFINTIEIVEKVLGIELHSFGTPYNQNDETLIQVINQFPQIRVFLFPRTAVTNQLELSIVEGRGRLNIENEAVGNMDFDYFMTNYETYDSAMDYMVLQAHPGNFKAANYRDFERMCSFLMEQGHRFMTPYEYYNYRTEKSSLVAAGG
ncbi:MAG: polysaccharide deacetylase family protein [Spirochaetales bacterium]|nr:polysaccharide deacetylase family protein [Spirochaetales bacterium]